MEVHKNSVDFSDFLHLNVVDYPNGRTRVTSQFTVQNAFGAELKYNVDCLMDADGLSEAKLIGP